MKPASARAVASRSDAPPLSTLPLSSSSWVRCICLLALFTCGAPNEGWSQGICDRTAQIRDLILAQLSGTACGDVTDQQLAGITELDANNNLQGLGITTLRADDFAGLVNLEHLDLRHNDLAELPAGFFTWLPALTVFRVDHNPDTGGLLGVYLEVVEAGAETADGVPVRVRMVQGAPVEYSMALWAPSGRDLNNPPYVAPIGGRRYAGDPIVSVGQKTPFSGRDLR